MRKFKRTLHESTKLVIREIAVFWQKARIIFCMYQLRLFHYRQDYRELLELAVILLGGIPTPSIYFQYPVAMHHARWISKAIYSLKIFMFRNQFKLTKSEENSFGAICIFLIRLYIKAWFGAPFVPLAPFQDLNF